MQHNIISKFNQTLYETLDKINQLRKKNKHSLKLDIVQYN